MSPTPTCVVVTSIYKNRGAHLLRLGDKKWLDPVTLRTLPGFNGMLSLEQLSSLKNSLHKVLRLGHPVISRMPYF